MLCTSAPGKKKAKIQVKKGELFLRRYLTMLYIMGYDEIEILFDGKARIERLRERLEELLGYALMDQGEHHVSIRNVAAPMEEESEAMQRRAFTILTNMAKELPDAWQGNDKDALARIAELEPLMDKLTNFCKRVINKVSSAERSHATYSFIILDHLEKMSDQFCHLASHLKDAKVTQRPELRSIMASLGELVAQLERLYFHMDKKALPGFKEKRKQLVAAIEKEFEHCRPKEARILAYCSALAELVMDTELLLVFL
ncbi:hypothetical protein COY28_06500 [Candidatus Woesearchaeota archaeon CG_4_10_14_0_2_um_filter_57_5]|nr:MAG: hypothetical protein COY28_06500 [Candidatus Woesearchaeota archaeon CG_4_10_14_0_2_um_filter_57_5]